MHMTFARAAVGAALTLGSVGAFYAGVAYASDPRLDQAIDNCNKAVVFLQAATNEGAKKNEFHGHRLMAIKEIQDAIKEIQAAKAYDDKTPAPSAPPPAPPPPPPAADGGKGNKPTK